MGFRKGTIKNGSTKMNLVDKTKKYIAERERRKDEKEEKIEDEGPRAVVVVVLLPNIFKIPSDKIKRRKSTFAIASHFSQRKSSY